MRKLLIAVLIAPWLLATGSENTDNEIQQAINHPDRPAADRERDASRKPGEVLAFFGITPGMAVLDVFSGGGYYAEIVSHLVGPDGTVIIHNNDAYINFVKDELAQRYAGGRLANITPIIAEANTLQLPEESIDAALLILGFHDFYYRDKDWPEIDTAKTLSNIFHALKPGGVFGVVDHRAEAGSPPETGNTLHRIDPALVTMHAEAAGFILEAESDILRNLDDSLTLHMGDQAIRSKTDRFVFRFRKP